MSELEDLIRDSMRGSEHQAPAGSGLLAQVARKEHLRRRRVQLASVAGTVAVVVAVVLAAGPVGHLAGTTTVNPGASPRPPAGATGSPTSSPLQPSTTVTSSATPAGADSVCGSWSGESSPFAQTVAKRYGPIESCFLYDHTWVITTDGLNAGPGYIGLAGVCTTSACLSGSTDHSHDTWTYYQAARPGSVRLYAAPVIGEPLQVTVGGVQETFDVTTKTFGGQSSIGPGALAASAPAVPPAAMDKLRQAVKRLAGDAASAAVQATLVSYRVHAWSSTDDFSLLVTVSLHFASTHTGAWAEGANERFVRFTRSPGDSVYHLAWASSP